MDDLYGGTPSSHALASIIQERVAVTLLAAQKLETSCKRTVKFGQAIDAGSVGSSLLQMKNLLLIKYLQNLVLIVMQKLAGLPLNATDAVWRSIEYRTLMESIRPLEHKLGLRAGLHAQREVLNKRETDEEVESEDEDELIGDVEEQDKPLSGRNRKKEFREKHRAEQEKLRQERRQQEDAAELAHDPLGEMKRTRKEKQQEKTRYRALRSGLLSEFRAELAGEPEELAQTVDSERDNVKQLAKERRDYEETHFTRVNVSKKQRQAEHSVPTVGDLGRLAEFREIRPLMRGSGGVKRGARGGGRVRRTIDALPSLRTKEEHARRHKASFRGRSRGSAGRSMRGGRRR